MGDEMDAETQDLVWGGLARAGIRAMMGREEDLTEEELIWGTIARAGMGALMGREQAMSQDENEEFWIGPALRVAARGARALGRNKAFMKGANRAFSRGSDAIGLYNA